MEKYAYRFSVPQEQTHGEYVTIPASALKDFNGMALELLNLLDFVIPGDGNSLHALSEKRSVDWSSIEQTLVDSIETGMRDGASLNPNPACRIEGISGWLAVRADHLVDDYWWVEYAPEQGKGSGEPPKTIDGPPAVAILRVRNSSMNLPYTAHISPRVTLNAPQH